MSQTKPAYGVFEGGGVKGIALIGVLNVMEKKGYKLTHVAGNSAGSIVAALVAAGLSAKEIRDFMMKFNFMSLLEPSGWGKVPLLGMPLQLHFKMGLYEAKHIEKTLGEILESRGIKTFGDLKTKQKGVLKYKLHVMASDISQGKLAHLPMDLPKYGIDPDTFEIAKAVRMSMSIPVLFTPQKLDKSIIVDGILVSNYPVWVFDSGPDPEIPTFGVKIMAAQDYRPKRIDNTPELVQSSILTMMEANDQRYIDSHDFKRTIHVNTRSIGIAEFWLDSKDKKKLIKTGEEAAEKFFDEWDFKAYKQEFGKQLGSKR